MFTWLLRADPGKVLARAGVLVVCCALLYLALFGLSGRPASATTAPTHAVPGDPVYNWSRLLDTAESWTGTGEVYNSDVQMFGSMSGSTPVILAGWAQGYGRIIFTVADLGDPVYVSYPQVTEFHVVVQVPPMSGNLRQLQVTVSLGPDKGAALTLSGPNILIGQPPLPLPGQ